MYENTQDPRFYSMELDADPNVKDLQDWINRDVLVGIVDEEAGIIGYCHRDRAARFVAAFNKFEDGA